MIRTDKLGDKALPTSCNGAKLGKDFGRTKIRTGKVIINKNIDIKNAYATACHECIHVYDGKRGLISIKLFDNAKQTLGYRNKNERREFDKLLLDLLGIDYYNKYKDDTTEILAYAYEEWLYGSNNRLVHELINGLLRTL